ncbi:MAG: flagellar biosynthesis protein FlhB [Rhodospirillales bacterium]|nr:flagellar biosynthesis protein FlhB [Rhodospirillales bacterium]
MADDATSEDRTEAATPRRLQRARQEGQVALSREAVVLGGMVGTVLAFHFMAASAARVLGRGLAAIVAHAGAEVPGAGATAFTQCGVLFLRATAPFVMGALLGGVSASLLQTGFLIHPAALRPDLSRISPIAGLRRIISRDAGVEALKSIAKIIAIGGIVWASAASGMRQLPFALIEEPRQWLVRLGALIGHILLASVLAQAGIAGLDLLWVRLRHGRHLRMSRQEIREEAREAEGDPKIRARIRQIRTQRARRRMLAAVPKATVVVTNPTHYAVALSYDRAAGGAPKLVAKGVDSMAMRIRETAMAHNVPLVANPPLARALYTVKLDADIPAEHYKAVAEIIAYVWRLGRRAHSPS